MDFKRLIFSLLFSLCAGTFLSFAFVKPARVGRKYFLYHGLGTAVLAVAAWAALQPDGMSLASWVFALGCGLFALTQGVKPTLAWIAFIPGTVGAVWGLWILGSGPQLLLSSLLLGFTMAAMLLGHWYLNVPGLNIAELRRVVLLLFAVLCLRALVAAWFLTPSVAGKNEMELYRYFFSSTAGIFLAMRWFWGLIGPLGLAYFIWETVKLSSTQSATGILYVAVVFVLIGETMAQYLTLFHGLPG